MTPEEMRDSLSEIDDLMKVLLEDSVADALTRVALSVLRLRAIVGSLVAQI